MATRTDLKVSAGAAGLGQRKASTPAAASPGRKASTPAAASPGRKASTPAAGSRGGPGKVMSPLARKAAAQRNVQRSRDRLEKGFTQKGRAMSQPELGKASPLFRQGKERRMKAAVDLARRRNQRLGSGGEPAKYNRKGLDRKVSAHIVAFATNCTDPRLGAANSVVLGQTESQHCTEVYGISKRCYQDRTG